MHLYMQRRRALFLARSLWASRLMGALNVKVGEGGKEAEGGGGAESSR